MKMMKSIPFITTLIALAVGCGTLKNLSPDKAEAFMRDASREAATLAIRFNGDETQTIIESSLVYLDAMVAQDSNDLGTAVDLLEDILKNAKIKELSSKDGKLILEGASLALKIVILGIDTNDIENDELLKACVRGVRDGLSEAVNRSLTPAGRSDTVWEITLY